MKYTDLIFDLYGTLVDIHTEEDDRVWEKTAFFFGFHGAHYEPAALKAAFQAAMRDAQAQAGQSYECYPDIPFEGILAQLFRDQGVVQEAQTLGFQAAQLFRICSLDYLRVYPHVRQTLAHLRAQGHRLWLLSNAQRAFTAYELRLLQLEDCFDGIYLSSDYRCRKPDSRFFRALLDDHHLNPATCLVIGNDRDTDIAGAQGVGLDTLYLHTPLTPAEQAAADPRLLPGHAPQDGHCFEFEGADWEKIEKLLEKL